MTATLWSTTTSNSPKSSNEINPPARRPTTGHGAADAAFGGRRDSVVLRVVIAGLLTLAALLAIAPRGHADASQNSQSLALVNQSRAQNGLPALAENGALDRIAQQHANEMVARNEIFHYTDLGNRMDAAGVNWTYQGENVGVGPTIKDVHTAFMQSPGHRQNVLFASYNIIGVGIAVGKDGSVFVAHEFAQVSSSAPAATKASAPAPAVAAHQAAPVHTASAPKVAPKAQPVVKVAAAASTPAPANNTTSSDPNALLGNVL